MSARGFSEALGVFQERLNNLMCTLAYVRTYVDDVLVITRGTYKNHLNKVEAVLDCLRLAKRRVKCQEVKLSTV